MTSHSIRAKERGRLGGTVAKAAGGVKAFRMSSTSAGFATKPEAPPRMASTVVAMLPYPVRITTCTAGARARSPRSTWSPEGPSTRGSTTARCGRQSDATAARPVCDRARACSLCDSCRLPLPWTIGRETIPIRDHLINDRHRVVQRGEPWRGCDDSPRPRFPAPILPLVLLARCPALRVASGNHVDAQVLSPVRSASSGADACPESTRSAGQDLAKGGKVFTPSAATAPAAIGCQSSVVERSLHPAHVLVMHEPSGTSCICTWFYAGENCALPALLGRVSGMRLTAPDSISVPGT